MFFARGWLTAVLPPTDDRRERGEGLVAFSVRNDDRLEVAATQRRLHAFEIERGDDVVRDDEDLLGRQAIQSGFLQ